MPDDILDDLARDLRYAAAVGLMHAVVRLRIARAVDAEVRKLRGIIVGLVDRVAAQSEVITGLAEGRKAK